MSEMKKILLTVVTIMVISDGDDFEILNSFVAAVNHVCRRTAKNTKANTNTNNDRDKTKILNSFVAAATMCAAELAPSVGQSHSCCVPPSPTETKH